MWSVRRSEEPEDRVRFHELAPFLVMMNKLTKRDHHAKLEHDEWLRQHNVHPEQLSKRLAAQKGSRDRVIKSSTGVAPPSKSGFAPIPGKQSIFDAYWKKKHYDDEEMELRELAALAKAEKLKNRIMPLYNKGPLQLASENEDLTKVGPLSRR